MNREFRVDVEEGQCPQCGDEQATPEAVAKINSLFSK